MSSKKSEPAKKLIHRRDNARHLDPRYAADLDALRTRNDPEGDRAFLDGRPVTDDDLAEELGENFVKNALTGQDGITEDRDEVVDEEAGGPFVRTSGGIEFAQGTDASNPRDALREPFPRT